MAFDVLFFLAMLVPLLALPWAWLTLPKGFIQPQWRSWVGFASLVAITLQTLAFIGAFFTIGVVGGSTGFDEKVQFWIGWMKINRIACLAIMLAALFSKGRFRWASFSTAALMVYAALVYEMK